MVRNASNPEVSESFLSLSFRKPSVESIVPLHPYRSFHSRTWERLVIPSTKQMESSMFDFPDPFKPVMALK